MFRICAVLAMELLEPREADESIAKPPSATEFWEGDFPRSARLLPMATNQSRPGDV
jgi:hypothetical protein